MKYHLMLTMDATPENWRLMLRAFSSMAHSRSEPYVQAMHDHAEEASILQNHRDEPLAFMTGVWQPAFATLMNPEFATSEPHTFELTRKRWGLTIRLWYCDRTGKGLASEGIHLSVRSRDPQEVQEFAEATNIYRHWCGSLNFDGNRSCAPSLAADTYPQMAIFHLICTAKAKEKEEAAAEAAAATTA